MKPQLIEHHLTSILQKNVSFVVNGKTTKEGKLILFNIKDFYISFHIITPKNQTKLYEIPMPYDVQKVPGAIRLNYEIETVTRKDLCIRHMIMSLYKKFGKKSKLFDNTMDIKLND